MIQQLQKPLNSVKYTLSGEVISKRGVSKKEERPKLYSILAYNFTNKAMTNSIYANFITHLTTEIEIDWTCRHAIFIRFKINHLCIKYA